MTTGTSDLAVALYNVRQAYRLIYHFQNRANDTIKSIQDQFGGLEFFHWMPTYTNLSPSKRRNPIDIRPDNFFSLYDFSLLYQMPRIDKFSNNDEPINSDILEINLEIDANASRALVEGGLDTFELEMNTPASPETTQSTLSLYLWTREKNPGSSRDWVNDVWSVTPWPDSETNQPEQNEAGWSIGCKFPLTKLSGLEKIKAATDDAQRVFKAMPRS